ncbi:hypothetical protein OJAV_G00084100 [Oryzias javanicus]|uniref:IF rod domain-containing protein n=1 Tax=Oryzias javanicus TaxID=123683 RepID=A0A437D5P8_ORYJA|nr:hypothetical protein OJAV_G00084100 [Oryzias javanicus]
MSSFSSRSFTSGARLGSMRAPPVHAFAAGQGSSIARAPRNFSSGGGFSSSAGGFNLADAVDISDNKKVTMQNLNDRLGSYLEKVRRLEEANGELEKQIRDFVGSKTQSEGGDYSSYLSIISDLREQVMDALRTNGSLVLMVDNARLAYQDFQTKYDTELVMRQNVEADIAGMKRLLDDLTLERSDLEMEIESLKEELIHMKTRRDEDMEAQRSQVSAQVNVEVDAPPQQDLSSIMEDMRNHYETIAEKNRKDLEKWHQNKVAELNKSAAVSSEVLQSSQSEVTELKRTLQSLEIERDAQLAMKASLENMLAETECRYGGILEFYQIQKVTSTEKQLERLRSDVMQQQQKYEELLDTKVELEREIREYQVLLEGEAGSSSSSTSAPAPAPAPSSSTKRKVVIVTQEFTEDGEVTTETEEIQ